MWAIHETEIETFDMRGIHELFHLSITFLFSNDLALHSRPLVLFIQTRTLLRKELASMHRTFPWLLCRKDLLPNTGI